MILPIDAVAGICGLRNVVSPPVVDTVVDVDLFVAKGSPLPAALDQGEERPVGFLSHFGVPRLRLLKDEMVVKSSR